MGLVTPSQRELIKEQVFDRRGTYLGKVSKAAFDARGASIEAYEIELDPEAAEEIFGEPVGGFEVEPMELEIHDVLRLTSTIEELRDRVDKNGDAEAASA